MKRMIEQNRTRSEGKDQNRTRREGKDQNRTRVKRRNKIEQ